LLPAVPSPTAQILSTILITVSHNWKALMYGQYLINIAHWELNILYSMHAIGTMTIEDYSECCPVNMFQIT